MKIQRSFAVLVVMLLVSISAQAAVAYIGTCEGKLATVGQSKTGSGTISPAVILPKDSYQNYDGASITALRFGLVTTTGISNVKVWLRHSLEGENIAEVDVASPVQGWNEVELPSPVVLDASDDLVLGYSFDQSSSVKCISVAGQSHANGYWVAKNGVWDNRSAQVSGSLSIEARVEGEMVNNCNLSIISAAYDRLCAYGDDFHATIVVQNTAPSTINGYSFIYDINGEEATSEERQKTLVYHQRDTFTVVIPTNTIAEAVKVPVNVFISAIGDENPNDDRTLVYLSSYTQTMPHKVLLEEFSTEKCPNCPRAHSTIRTCMEEGYDAHTILVTHHVGYGTDWLTVNDDKNYLWFYGEDGTFAPAGMFDRNNRPEFHMKGGSDDLRYPVFSIGYPDTFRPSLESAIALPSFVSITPTVTYDSASRLLDLTVDMEKLEALDALTDNPRLTVFLTEDSIIARDQAGVSSSSYPHRHTCRKTLTDVWGDAITFDAQMRASAHYSFVLPEEWNDKYVDVVVFVNNYNPDDRNDCNVLNAEHASLNSSTNGINTPEINADGTELRIYTIDGRRVQKVQKGIYIINGRKEVF